MEILYENFLSLFSVEGLKYKRANCFTMQYNPEGNTGPMEVKYVFDRIVEIMGGAK